ncbi:MAG: DUF4278 domain-containing protein [Cyanobacteriota bacterium]|nr:DUF4278 domain-containing protein [Cyanobacteriota bacterium]
MTSQLRYRGLAYDPAFHEKASDRPVEHTYRGRTYTAPLRHLETPTEIQDDLRYRGHAYRSRRSQGSNP